MFNKTFAANGTGNDSTEAATDCSTRSTDSAAVSRRRRNRRIRREVNHPSRPATGWTIGLW